MREQVNNYLFYYPSTNIGGAQLLMARTAEYLISKNETVTILVQTDIQDDFISRFLNERNLRFNIINVSENNNYIGKENEVLILPQPTVFKLYKVLDTRSQNRIFQWDTHPVGVVAQLSFGKYIMNHRGLLRRTIKMLDAKKYLTLKKYLINSHNKKSIYFMCNKNFELNKEVFKLSFTPSYLALPIPIKDDYIKNNKYNTGEVNAAWVGRLDSLKYLLVEMVIKDILIYNNKNNTQIKFYIIGDGEYKEKLQEIYKFDWLLFVGIKPNESIAKFYKENKINVGFNVGTSALEAAEHGLYSILLPGLVEIDFYSKKKNKYLELFNSKNFDVSLPRNRSTEALSLDKILESITNKGIECLSEKCRRYVINNHSYDVVFEKLYNTLGCTKMTFQDLINMNIFHSTTIQSIKRKMKHYRFSTFSFFSKRKI